MSPLNYGLTPKMKPVAPKRAALDRGARCRHQQDRLPDRQAEAAAAAGRVAPAQPCRRGDRVQPYRFARHEGRPRGRSRRGRGGGASRGRPRRAQRQLPDRIRHRVDVGGPAGERASERRRSRSAGRAVGEREISRVLAAGSRQSARDGRVVLHSLPIGFTLDDAHGVRDPRGMLASRFGVDMHVVTADARAGPQPDAGGRALPSAGRGHGGRPLRREPRDARRRRGRPRRRRHRYGRRHHHDGGILRTVGSSMPTVLPSAAGT